MLGNGQFIDNDERENEVKKQKRSARAAGAERPGVAGHAISRQTSAARRCGEITESEGDKGGRRMPRLPEAMKDAASCEKARGTASRYRSVRVRMGQPGGLEARHTEQVGERGELKHLSTRRKRKKTSIAVVVASEPARAQTGAVEAVPG